MDDVNHMDELKKIYEIINDLWKFEKKFNVIQDTDDYWRAVCEESEALYQKHGTQLCQDLIIACVADMERRRGGFGSS